MYYYLAIAVGGAVGAVSRYWLSSLVERFNHGVFPIGTFAVNIIGSLLIGFVFILLLEKLDTAAYWRPILIIGFLGAMTTFSTFSLDAVLLMQQGFIGTAIWYIFTSVIVCLLAVWLGMQISRLFL